MSGENARAAQMSEEEWFLKQDDSQIGSCLSNLRVKKDLDLNRKHPVFLSFFPYPSIGFGGRLPTRAAMASWMPSMLSGNIGKTDRMTQVVCV